MTIQRKLFCVENAKEQMRKLEIRDLPNKEMGENDKNLSRNSIFDFDRTNTVF